MRNTRLSESDVKFDFCKLIFETQQSEKGRQAID